MLCTESRFLMVDFSLCGSGKMFTTELYKPSMGLGEISSKQQSYNNSKRYWSDVPMTADIGFHVDTSPSGGYMVNKDTGVVTNTAAASLTNIVMSNTVTPPITDEILTGTSTQLNINLATGNYTVNENAVTTLPGTALSEDEIRLSFEISNPTAATITGKTPSLSGNISVGF